jgi:nickel-type superoxide dismutase maturation protease
MNAKTRRRLMRAVSRVPGLYSALAFVLARRTVVSGWSMAPALLPGERLLFDRLAYVRRRPRRGDVVLVAHPLEPALRMVKRITAMPGDVVEGGRVLAPGQYWVEGDNPGLSTDSREFGPVERGDLLGRAWILYWPAERWRIWD